MVYTIVIFIFSIISLIILEYELQDIKKVEKIMSILNIRNKKEGAIFFIIGLSVSNVTQAMLKIIKNR